MGSSASVNASSVHSELTGSLMAGSVWVEFLINTTSNDRFHMVELICGTPQATLAASSGKLVLVSGCSWDKGQIPRPEDCEKHFHNDGHVSFAEEQAIMELVETMGLLCSYKEHFPKPASFTRDQVFVNCVFKIRSAAGSSFVTELSGCLLKSDVLEPMEESVEVELPWQSHLGGVLPGPRFEHDRVAFTKWWPIVQRQVESAREMARRRRQPGAFFSCAEQRSSAFQKMLAQEDDPEKSRKFRDEAAEWRAKALAAATSISRFVLDAMFGEGKRLIAHIYDKGDETRIEAALDRLNEAKLNLANKFDHDILELTTFLEKQEDTAWQQLSSRYAKKVEGGDSASLHATERIARGQLTSQLTLMKALESRLQDAAFLHASRFEFECTLFEIFASSRLDAYYSQTRARLQSKWDRAKATEWTALQVEQAKLRAQLMAQDMSEREMADVVKQQDEEDYRLENKLNETLRKKEAQFEMVQKRNMTVFAAKLEDIRRQHESASISAAGLEKLKAICQIYQRLRPK